MLVISPLGLLQYTERTCGLLVLLHFFLYRPLDLRTSEWTAREYVMNSRGYGVILISRYWILHSLEIAPNFDGPSFGKLRLTCEKDG